MSQSVFVGRLPYQCFFVFLISLWETTSLYRHKLRSKGAYERRPLWQGQKIFPNRLNKEDIPCTAKGIRSMSLWEKTSVMRSLRESQSVCKRGLPWRGYWRVKIFFFIVLTETTSLCHHRLFRQCGCERWLPWSKSESRSSVHKEGILPS